MENTEPLSNPSEQIRADEVRLADFQHLFTEYNQSIFNFFANRGFSKEDSRDLTQETFLQAFHGRHGFRSEAQPHTWLRAVAANTLKRKLRDQNRDKRKARELSLDHLDEPRHLRLVEDPGPSEAGSPLGQALKDESSRLVREAVDELPERMRMCVRLLLDRGLKYREIAVTLKISEGSVKSQISEARVKLKQRLAPHFHADSDRRSS